MARPTPPHRGRLSQLVSRCGELFAPVALSCCHETWRRLRPRGNEAGAAGTAKAAESGRLQPGLGRRSAPGRPGPAASEGAWVLLCACTLILTAHTYVTYACHMRTHSIPPVDTVKCIDQRGALRGLGTQGGSREVGALHDWEVECFLGWWRDPRSEFTVSTAWRLSFGMSSLTSNPPRTSGWECGGGSPSGPGLRVLRRADPPARGVHVRVAGREAPGSARRRSGCWLGRRWGDSEGQ